MAPTGDGPTGAAIGDLDQDGIPDLVSANFVGETVSFLKGVGDGTFATNVDLALDPPAGASAVKIADVNADGAQDLIVAAYVNAIDESGVVVYLNQKTTPFDATMNFSVPQFYPALGTTSIDDVNIADLNGDGALDIVATADNVDGVVTVYLNQPVNKGVFSAGVNYAVENRARTALIGDWTNDGKLDLLVTNLETTTLNLLAGNGDGTFQDATSITTGNSPFGAAAEDLNGDGKADVVTANFGSPGDNVSVLLSSAAGTLSQHTEYPTGVRPAWVATGDLNRDGKADIVTANTGTANVSLLTGKGDGTFNAKQDYDVGVNPQYVLLADVDGDGLRDIVAANVNDNNVSVLLNMTTCTP